jgi:hypothetical protein
VIKCILQILHRSPCLITLLHLCILRKRVLAKSEKPLIQRVDVVATHTEVSIWLVISGGIGISTTTALHAGVVVSQFIQGGISGEASAEAILVKALLTLNSVTGYYRVESTSCAVVNITLLTAKREEGLVTETDTWIQTRLIQVHWRRHLLLPIACLRMSMVAIVDIVRRIVAVLRMLGASGGAGWIVCCITDTGSLQGPIRGTCCIHPSPTPAEVVVFSITGPSYSCPGGCCSSSTSSSPATITNSAIYSPSPPTPSCNPPTSTPPPDATAPPPASGTTPSPSSHDAPPLVIKEEMLCSDDKIKT